MRLVITIFLLLNFNSYAAEFLTCKSAISTQSIATRSDRYLGYVDNLIDYSVDKKNISTPNYIAALIGAERAKFIAVTYYQIYAMMNMHEIMRNDSKVNREGTMEFIKINFTEIDSTRKFLKMMVEQDIDAALKRELLDLLIAIEKDMEVYKGCIQ